MGQGQSQQAEAPMSGWDPSISPEERARAQEELRVKQQVALDKRLATKKKKAASTASATAPAPMVVEQTSDNISELQSRRPVISESASEPEPEPEPAPEPEQQPELSTEEQAQAQADMRAKQQVALNKRFAAKQKKPTSRAGANPQANRKLSALEQASRENVGYRNMDTQADFRSWN